MARPFRTGERSVLPGIHDYEMLSAKWLDRAFEIIIESCKGKLGVEIRGFYSQPPSDATLEKWLGIGGEKKIVTSTNRWFS